MLTIEGERYGKFTIIGQAEPTKNGAWRVLARCDCGLEWAVGYHGLWQAKRNPGKGCRSCKGQARLRIGDRCGEWTIIEAVGHVNGGYRYKVRCNCGTIRTMLAADFKRSQACRACRGYKQGRLSLRFPAEYAAWKGIRRRCRSDTRWAKDYHDRGITMCPEWANDFGAFLRDVGPRPNSEYTLDRSDNDRGYAPGNVRWATWAQQNRNKRWNVMLTHDGVTMCVKDWADKLGITKGSLAERLQRGWSVAEAVTTPPKSLHDKRVRYEDMTPAAPSDGK